MTRPKHIASDAGYYFVTTSTHDRASLFRRPDLADIVINALYDLRSRGKIKLYGFVVMPDHVHMVISVPGDEDLPRVMHSLKSYTAHAINDARGGNGKVWQDGYYDYAIRNIADAERKLRYVLGNPLRDGLVQEFDKYTWSSASGKYEVDPF